MNSSKLRRADLRSIHYGHFGVPLYDPTSKRWNFSKLNCNTRFFQLSQVPEDLVQPTASADSDVYLRDDADGREERYDNALESELRQLVDSFPELQPAEDLVKPMVRLSEGVAKALDEYDPSVGELLASSAISHRAPDGQREMISILALPGGMHGEALRLIRLHEPEYMVDEHVFGLMIPDKETGWWAGKGAPILQISSSQNIEGKETKSLLAVRLQGCIIFMFPRYRNHPVPASGDQLPTSTIPASRIDCNILFELHPWQAQYSTFSDVMFNPWKEREVVVIDQSGGWSVFRIQRSSHTAPVYSPVPIFMGKMPEVEEEREPDDMETQNTGLRPAQGQEDEQTENREENASHSLGFSPDQEDVILKPEPSEYVSRLSSERLEDTLLSASDVGNTVKSGQASPPELRDSDHEIETKLRQDGWARVTWIFNHRTLIACTRRSICLIDVPTGASFDLPPLLPQDRYLAGWHLDMRLCWRRSDHLFVLTSQSLFLLRVFEDSKSNLSDTEINIRGRILISVLHFRDESDISLKMRVNEEDNGCLITIFSQYNAVATCFWFEIPTDGQVAASNAMALALPEHGSDRTLDFKLERVLLDQSPDEMAKAGTTFAGRLYSAMVLKRDLGLRHVFYDTKEPTDTIHFRLPHRAKSGRAIELDAHGAFVVPDTFEESLSSNEESDGSSDNKYELNTRAILNKPHKVNGKNQRLAIAVMEGTAEGGSKEFIPVVNIDHLTEQVQSQVLKQKDPAGREMTLFELTRMVVPQVVNLRDASFALEDAFASSSDLAVVRLYPQIIPLDLDLGKDPAPNDMPFDDLYAYLEENYITPLNGDFSNAFRLQREEIAKAIAAEIILASAKIEQNVRQEDAENVHDDDMDMDADDLSIAASQQSVEFSRGFEEREGRSVLRTPSSRTPSTSRSRSPYRKSVNDAMSEIVDRLSHSVAMDIKPTQSWGLKPMTVLSHWELGVDPIKYSYTDTKKRLEEERIVLGMSEKERRRLERRKEKDVLRRRKEEMRAEQLGVGSSQAPTVVSSQVSGPGGSQLPPIFSGSQPPPISSSQVPPNLLAAQQSLSSGAPKPPRSSQVPGFGSQQPATRGRSQGSIPGFGSQSIENPKATRAKAIPGFGSQPLPTPSRSQVVPSVTSSSQRNKNISLGYSNPEQNEAGSGRTQSVHRTGEPFSRELPVRPTSTPPVFGSSQLQSTQDGSQLSIPSSQQPQMPGQHLSQQRLRLSSQISGTQTPKKKKKRTEGF
ncbi:uncharacterized protein PV09_07156 [Verruconis gallopava]|uniref:RNA polymerase I-specific transcription initiation factor RRN6-like protein n=1 Tax=Verruconis gallopava TaxID=253628 RepID=A0A0D2AQG3_9PEZI|nr:uncharacterized protein PV09_07156 [Verruconis gallopava]KIW01389.1 hypothetical protein PV09_07156 [Verruconis gallopava]